MNDKQKEFLQIMGEMTVADLERFNQWLDAKKYYLDAIVKNGRFFWIIKSCTRGNEPPGRDVYETLAEASIERYRRNRETARDK